MTTHNGTTDPADIRPPWATDVDLESGSGDGPELWYSTEVGTRICISTAFVLQNGVWRPMDDGRPLIMAIPREVTADEARALAADLITAADLIDGAHR